MSGSDTGNVNFDIGRFRKDMLCNIYKNNMSFLRLKHCFEKDKKQKEKYETI